METAIDFIYEIYFIEFYSGIKKNEILSFAGKWMELESIILSEVSQVQKTKSHVFSCMWNRPNMQYYSLVCV
jgi:hypothetical protein